jgi:hypothetical protein
MDTRAIIDYAMNDDAKAMRDALYASIHDRVNAHIQAQKQEVAQNIFPEEVEEFEEEVEQIDELSLQTMKSAKEKLGSKALDAHYNDDKRSARNYAGRALHMGSKIKRKERSASSSVKEEYEEIDEALGNNEKRHLDSIIKMKEVKKSKHDMAPSIHDHMEDALENGNHKKIDQLHKVFKHVTG